MKRKELTREFEMILNLEKPPHGPPGPHGLFQRSKG